ncbi:glucose-6-phosphate dehydrogenase [Naasia lichenicola]|uniref:Glucose-6-phosphate dehydrogenase n=1 Tax=Naasia lichenicola TaxID=2565933 RepID=A0A4S4FF39_9MICO|nr:glucose-6-phosphate dehydrogenase [Naasia lichenicola]THG28741.1 glucose-6-phosphate dehydrogenase [Naasia lichenicola]
MSDVGTLIILGASGDLTERLLLPGLGSLIASDDPKSSALATDVRIIGSGRSAKTDEVWRQTVTSTLQAGGASGSAAKALASKASYIQADPTVTEDLGRILGEAEGVPVIYFALPPAIVSEAITAMAEVELPKGTILAVEKPFGSDSRSAAALNRKLEKLVPERQIHRIDHFLGLPTVLGILGLRFANRLFEPIWNAQNIERVEITYDEQLGLEGRAGYYDTAGALIDMLQSHLMQVLSVVAMEPPISMDETEFRAATSQAIRAISLWSGDPVLPGTDGSSRRARYTAGTIEGRKFPDYASEEGVDPTRKTETLAEIALEVRTARWAGVPFILRSGKAIGDPRREIVLTFRPTPFLPTGLSGPRVPERIVLGIHPQTLALDVAVNGRSEPFHLEHAAFDVELAERDLTAYGEVLAGVLGSDPTLSVLGDVAEQCWRIVSPVLKAWRADEIPLDEYRAGSRGPSTWS